MTSVKFTCPDRQPLYRAGDRVSVTWPVSMSCDSELPDYILESWPATVVEEKGARFVICVDDVDSDDGTPARSYLKSETLYAKVSAGKLKALDEPKRSVCGICGIVAGNDLGRCWQEGAAAPQRGCLKAILAKATSAA